MALYSLLQNRRREVPGLGRFIFWAGGVVYSESFCRTITIAILNV